MKTCRGSEAERALRREEFEMRRTYVTAMQHQNTATLNAVMHRSSPPDVFLGKVVLKICRKFTGEHPCRSAISKKLHFDMGVLLKLAAHF